jgi:glycosyltransferase 2 family protein
MNARARFSLQAFAFLALTIGGGWWAYQRGGVVPDDLLPLKHLPAASVALIVALSVGLYVSDAWRYVTAARAIDVDLSWGTAIHASIACNFFSCLTPGAAFGAPAALVMLARSGLSWELSTIISFAKSTIGSAMLQTGAFIFLVLGLGPVLPHTVTGLLLWGSGLSAAGMGLLFLGGLYPKPVKRLARAFDTYLANHPTAQHSLIGRGLRRLMTGLVESVDRLRQFRPMRLPEVMLSQVVYFGCFIGLAVVLGVSLGAVLSPKIWGVSTVYVAFLYVAPTPGGAGLAEGTAQDFFGAVLAPAGAVMTVLLFRALTFYLYVVVGLAHVMWVGGVSSVLAEADAGGVRGDA